MKKDTVSIKGTKNGLVILLDSSQKFEDIKQNLQKKMESSKGFFEGAKFTFYAARQNLFPDQQNELENICMQYGLIPVYGTVAKEAVTLFEHDIDEKDTAYHRGPEDPAILINRTMRSGQQVFHPAHVVVLGNVHPGATIKSGGNIIIMGTCSGTVHAGAQGDPSATVTAFQLKPQVLRIANYLHNGPPVEHLKGGPQKARVDKGNIVFSSCNY